jgi:lipoate-protein ligase A
MFEGRKIVGSAQVRQGTAFLQHGSILLENNQDFIQSVIQGASSSEPSAAETRSGPRLRAREVAIAISTAADARWAGNWKAVSDAEPVLSDAMTHHGRFRSAAWTWLR